MKKNLTDLYVADYTSLYREDEDDYSYIYEKGRYEFESALSKSLQSQKKLQEVVCFLQLFRIYPVVISWHSEGCNAGISCPDPRQSDRDTPVPSL